MRGKWSRAWLALPGLLMMLEPAVSQTVQQNRRGLRPPDVSDNPAHLPQCNVSGPQSQDSRRGLRRSLAP